MDHNNWKLMYNCLMPGIKSIVERHGHIFSYCYFSPCIIIKNKVIEINMLKLINMAYEDKYNDIITYIDTLCRKDECVA